MLTIYEYAKCSTCRSALKHLDAKKVKYTKIPIVDQPPTAAELKRMLGYLKAAGKTLRNLFNTSGEQYRALRIGERLKAGMTEAEAIALLAKNGKLIKRPFILSARNGAIGFQPEVLDSLL